VPTATVRNVHINYEVLGTRGPWLALSPGGRRALDGVRGLAQLMADAGYRVLIHDRRNCGASDVVIEGDESEFQLWADDLHELLSQLNALPVVVGGSSSGCRTSLVFALRYPSAVRALLLWRVTGGAFAANRLAYNYYTQYIEALQRGGMAAVCETEHWRERIEARPENRQRLMALSPERFSAVMSNWREYFLRDADLPVIGATEEQLRSIAVPTCVVPGNDRTHGHAVGEAAHRLIPNSEQHDLFPGDTDVDLVPPDEWQSKDAELARIFSGFLARAGIPGETRAAATSG
jgi:pimeloyl-ACP methyl ester carboxylesterase